MDMMDEAMDDAEMSPPSNDISGEPAPQNESKPVSSILRPGSMVMMTITSEDYEQSYWPKLRTAIQQLLTMTPGEYIPISYEQMYSCVYKCVCKQFSDRLYEDLTNEISTYLNKVTLSIESPSASIYIENFDRVLKQYMQALSGIVPIFNYMNRFHIVSRLKTDLNTELLNIFIVSVADRHVPALIPHLVNINATPFQVQPDVMANLIKNIYQLSSKYADLHPTLFAKYLPNILPACSEDKIAEYVEEARLMQKDIMTHPSFSREENKKKRQGDDDNYSHQPGGISLNRPTHYNLNDD